MSTARVSTCLFCSFRQATKRQAVSVPRRRLHISPPKRQSNDRNGNQDESEPHHLDKIRRLTKEEIQQNYTRAQAAAIEATQSHLKFDDEYKNTTVQSKGSWKMSYVEDMTEIDPVLDKPVRAPWTNLDDNARLKTEDELDEDIMNFMQNMPENDKEAADAFQRFIDTNRITVGKETAELNPRSAISPETGKVFKDKMEEKQMQHDARQTGEKDRDNAAAAVTESSVTSEISPGLLRLIQMSGMSEIDIARLRVKSIVSHRVTNQTRLGKIQKQYWLSIAGNQNGLLGVGEGKSEEAAEGLIQSQYRAIRNMVPIQRYENRTIYGEVRGKEGAVELKLFARPPGKYLPFSTLTGLISHRFRFTLSASYLGDVPMRRYTGHCCSCDSC